MRRTLISVVAMALVVVGLQSGIAAASDQTSLKEFTIDKDALCQLRDQWVDKLLAANPKPHWAKMKMELTDRQLDMIGLPSREVLTAQDYPTPTLVTKSGATYDVPTESLENAMSPLPQAGTFAGTGCLGIRPGSLLLIVDGSGISLCSMAHVYGAAGGYSISTAGHCGGVGTTATVIAAFGNRADATGVVLLDFGRFSTSHNNSLGDDYALISIDPAYQALTTPTMCFWGGPRGSYTAQGRLANFDWPNNQDPTVSVDPNPFLAQTVVHYGHGVGVGAGGTPRAGEAIAWNPDSFMFFGAIAPGDSGSGANTLLGDTVGANMQAAGIMTHLWVDPLMRDGFGIMGGTRVTMVGTPAVGQIVPYPFPVAGLP
ncbi:MAG: hypothetical protein QOG04_203 [Actinomycetota bacterium]|jgi:hypothetical protein|nr:hypothetical protein [Actinomycetota bacterium]